MAEKRYRNFASLVYPESATENWLDILSEELVPVFVSPLHDKDMNPTGEPKKAHYHVLFMFEGVKTFEQVQEIVDKIGGVGCKQVQSIRAYARYLCHMDNGDKAQYSEEDVISFGGADYAAVCNIAADRYKAVGDMMDFCCDNFIYSYSDLLEHARKYNPAWFRLLCDNASFVMKEYLKAKAWRDGITNEVFRNAERQ